MLFGPRDHKYFSERTPDKLGKESGHFIEKCLFGGILYWDQI